MRSIQDYQGVTLVRQRPRDALDRGRRRVVVRTGPLEDANGSEKDGEQCRDQAHAWMHDDLPVCGIPTCKSRARAEPRRNTPLQESRR